MIQPDFLAQLRYRYAPCEVLFLVQLEQCCPGWWPSHSALAEQLGMHKNTLRKSLRILDKEGLIASYTQHGRGGFWLWWVRRHADDVPTSPPYWEIRDIHTRGRSRIPVDGAERWSADIGCKYNTAWCFLSGRIKTFRGRWQLVSTPLDVFDVPPVSDS